MTPPPPHGQKYPSWLQMRSTGHPRCGKHLRNLRLLGFEDYQPGYDEDAAIEPRAVCRRAWVACVFPEIGEEHLVAVAIDPGARRAPEDASPAEPPAEGRQGGRRPRG